MKQESGVHRVQRVPKAEPDERIHTSMIRAAVMPEVEEAEVEIDEKDMNNTILYKKKYLQLRY